MNNSSILSFTNVESIPNGKMYSSNDVLCIFHENEPIMTYYTRDSTNSIPLKELDIDATTDRVISVDLYSDSRLFILSSKKNLPIAYFIAIKNTEDSHLPRLMQVCCSAVAFHKKILNVFIPKRNVFCIISREGVSFHTLTLKTIYTSMTLVKRYSFVDNYLMLSTSRGVTILEIKDDGTITDVLKDGKLQLSIPITLLRHSDYLSLVYIEKDENCQSIIFQKISFDGKLQQNIKVSDVFDTEKTPDTYNYQTFDDTVLVYDDEQNACIFDISTDKAIYLSQQFKLQQPISRIIFDNFGYNQNNKFKISFDFENIISTDPDVIGAVFRRTNSLSRALTLFSQTLKETSHIEDVKLLINATAPYAINSVAQVRYVRAIQFASIAEPHLILLALINTCMIMGNKMIDAAKNALFEILAHNECMFTMKNLIASWNMKLNEYALQILAPKLGEEIELAPEFVQDILVYADICIESDKPDIAKRLILRYIFDQMTSVRDIEEIRAKYLQKFGCDPIKDV